MGVSAGEIALNHRLDIELADLVPLAVAMDPHHANPAFSISVPDQRHAQKPPVHRANPARRIAPAKADTEQRSCHWQASKNAIGLA